MTLVGYKGKNHRQQVDKRGADDTVDDRETGPDTFEECLERWGPFTLDVAAAPHNAKCKRFYTLQDDALQLPWHGEHVWCNPPYSDLGAWIEKAMAEFWLAPFDTTITMLLPANRTEQRWWQDSIEEERDKPESPMMTRFLYRRRRFIQAGSTEIKPNERPPFGSVVVDIRSGNR